MVPHSRQAVGEGVHLENGQELYPPQNPVIPSDLPGGDNLEKPIEENRPFKKTETNQIGSLEDDIWKT